jgi:predicted esterase
LLESIEIITKIIKEEVAALKSSKKVFLGGFLQGCCLALAVYLKLTPDIQLGGIFGGSGGHVFSSWNGFYA